VLLSTAYLDEAERCDEVVLLHDGKLLAQGEPASLQEPLRGRTFAVTSRSLAKRALQARLAQTPDVLDALIQGEHVRIVMREHALPPAADTLLPGLMDVEINALPPRFEDSFVAMLKTRAGSESNHAGSPKPVGDVVVQKNSAAPMIEVQNLTRRFGSFQAVKNVTLAVAEGEVFGLLGANGAGKSTMFRMLCGLLPPSSGSLRVAGADLRYAAAAARARIGYMSQKFSLYGNLSVVENLRFLAAPMGCPASMATNG
jgi:ABC-type multidrug transport system, ATPase component